MQFELTGASPAVMGRHRGALGIWFTLLCVWSYITNGLPSACPLDFSGLDFTEATSACTRPNYGSCCSHLKALVAVAISQYSNTTNNLGLSPDITEPCKLYLNSTLQANSIQANVSTFCGLRAGVGPDSPCKNFTTVSAISRGPGFDSVVLSCASQNLTGASCGKCLDANQRFLSSLLGVGGDLSTWKSCAYAAFLSVASLGDSDYAMQRANCFFQLQTPLQQQSECPFELPPWQVQNVATACNTSSGDLYACCSSGLLALRVGITQMASTSGAFVVSNRQGARCIKNLETSMRDLKLSQLSFQACNISSEEIFQVSTRGCYGISTKEELIRVVNKQGINFLGIEMACKQAINSCDTCRKGVLDATYAAGASLGGSILDPTVLQSCTDLVFLALASNATAAEATETGDCLYALPEKALTPKASPQPRRPALTAPPHSADTLLSTTDARSTSRLSIVLAIGVVVTGLALTLLLLLILLIQRKNKDRREPKPLTGKGMPVWNKDVTCKPRSQIRNWSKDSSPLFRHFKLHEIRRATDNFSTIIGRGGFGTVYKARFKDGLVAAVKRMNKGTHQGEQGFCKEMELLGRLHHRHLVTLRGFCAERHERFLVYEYMENGSLKEQLHAHLKTALNWRTRLRIAMGVAAGLEYLHSYCDPPLCHRDIKSSNILLDEDFVAKVADFGLAHAAPSGASIFEPVTTDVRGTPGYMDPEYVVTQELTEKSDVYSYGVLLLELITARRAVHENTKLVDWAQKYMDNEAKVTLMVDPDLEHTYNLEELLCLVSIVKICTQSEGKARPTMRQVVKLLYDKFHVENKGTIASLSVSFSRISPLSNLSTPLSKQLQAADLSNYSDEAGSIKSIHSPTVPASPTEGGRQSFHFNPTPPVSPPFSPVNSDRS